MGDRKTANQIIKVIVEATGSEEAAAMSDIASFVRLAEWRVECDENGNGIRAFGAPAGALADILTDALAQQGRSLYVAYEEGVSVKDALLGVLIDLASDLLKQAGKGHPIATTILAVREKDWIDDERRESAKERAQWLRGMKNLDWRERHDLKDEERILALPSKIEFFKAMEKAAINRSTKKPRSGQGSRETL